MGLAIDYAGQRHDSERSTVARAVAGAAAMNGSYTRVRGQATGSCHESVAPEAKPTIPANRPAPATVPNGHDSNGITPACC